MDRSFADAVLRIRLPEALSLSEPLQALGERANAPFDSMDADRRASLVGQLVRQLRSLPMASANALEQQLLVKLDAGPPLERELVLGDSLTLISLRSHVRHVLVYRRVDSAESMRLQSAVANVARVLARFGFTRVRIVTDALGHSVIFAGNVSFHVDGNSESIDALRSAEGAGYRTSTEGRVELRHTAGR